MSITGVFGLAGVGKSTYLSYLAAKALKSKDYQRIYSSFPIHGCYELKWDKLGIEDYSNCLILIDEISLFCDNRNWKDNMSDDMRYFWIMYRHYKCDVVYCSQSYKDCDSKIRDRTDMLYRITKLPILPISRVRPVIKSMALNDSGQWVEAYVERGLGCLVWRPKYYSMFDSFTCKQLKPNTSKLWTDLSACPQLPSRPSRPSRPSPAQQSRPSPAEPSRAKRSPAQQSQAQPNYKRSLSVKIRQEKDRRVWERSAHACWKSRRVVGRCVKCWKHECFQHFARLSTARRVFQCAVPVKYQPRSSSLSRCSSPP